MNEGNARKAIKMLAGEVSHRLAEKEYGAPLPQCGHKSFSEESISPKETGFIE